MSATKVTVHTAAVREVLKSDGVKSVLRDECEKAAARCNSLVQWHYPMQADAFGAAVQDGGFTAVGVVGMRRLGSSGQDRMAVAMYDAKHNVLMKGCGW